MKGKIKIGLVGLNYASSNFGCAALSYSFLRILDEALKDSDMHADVNFFFSINAKVEKNNLPKAQYNTMTYRVVHFDKSKIGDLIKNIRTNDLFFDFTSGDSFSDIYGMDRFKKTTFVKSAVQFMGKPLILGPQTYGPYSTKAARTWSRFVFNHAKGIYARDSMSVNRAKELTHEEVKLVTDVAFGLPYDPEKYTIPSHDGEIKVGVNLSGLLFSGGYTRDNQFGLKTDYRLYAEKLMENLMRNKHYEVYIIPHAIAADLNFPDNDLIPAEHFRKIYPEINIAPKFQDPMDAKSFISKMDIFTGARMHATIAAFSSGVCCIPFSYSPKFEGLYGDLGYERSINGKELSTEDSVKLTIDYIEQFEILKKEQDAALKIARERLGVFESDMKEIMRSFAR